MQHSSLIGVGDISRTMLPIAPKMPKMPMTFTLVIKLLKMYAMNDFVMVRPFFAKVLSSKNH